MSPTPTPLKLPKRRLAWAWVAVLVMVILAALAAVYSTHERQKAGRAQIDRRLDAIRAAGEPVTTWCSR